MKRNALFLTLAMFIVSAALVAQSTSAPQGQQVQGTNAATAKAARTAKLEAGPPAPFSRLAFSGGIGVNGVNLQVATNINKYLNVRGTGNFFKYTANNIDISNFGVTGKFDFATAGASLDFYPFPRHGFRLSPGVQFFNNNQVTATGVGASGSELTLNGQDFYSETANPMTVNGTLGLNTNKQAFTITTGWGNMISRTGGHWSVPFELGAAFTGVPTINMALSGYACQNAADAATSGETCVDMATNAEAQSDLAAQIAKWKSDLDPAKVYPILTIGIAYNFKIR